VEDALGLERERERDSAMSSGGGASLATVCVVRNVMQRAFDTRRHCEPPPDEKHYLPMPTPCS